MWRFTETELCSLCRVVKEEISDDNAKLPCFNGRVVSWVGSKNIPEWFPNLFNFLLMCSRLCSLYWCGQVAVWQLRAFVYNNDSHLLTSDHNHTSSPGREALCICVIMSSSHNDLSSSSSSTHASCFYKCVFRELAAMVFKVISYKVSTHASRHTQHMGHIHVLACSKSF